MGQAGRDVRNPTGLSPRRVLRTPKPLRSATVEINGILTTIPPALNPDEQTLLAVLQTPTSRHYLERPNSDLMLPPPVRRGEHTAAAAASRRLDRLDQHLELTHHVRSSQLTEVVRALHSGGRIAPAYVGTVVNAWGIPAIRMLGRFGS